MWSTQMGFKFMTNFYYTNDYKRWALRQRPQKKNKSIFHSRPLCMQCACMWQVEFYSFSKFRKRFTIIANCSLSWNLILRAIFSFTQLMMKIKLKIVTFMYNLHIFMDFDVLSICKCENLHFHFHIVKQKCSFIWIKYEFQLNKQFYQNGLRFSSFYSYTHSLF